MIKINSYNERDVFENILKNIAVYALVKNGFFYSLYIGLFENKEDAIKYLGYTSIEDFEKEQAQNNKDYNYSINKIDLMKWYNHFIKDDITREVIKKEHEIIEASEEKIKSIAQCYAEEWQKKAIDTLTNITFNTEE